MVMCSFTDSKGYYKNSQFLIVTELRIFLLFMSAYAA